MNQFRFTTILGIISSLSAFFYQEIKITALLMASGISCYYLTSALIPKISYFMIQKRIFGLDINKKGSKGGEK